MRPAVRVIRAIDRVMPRMKGSQQATEIRMTATPIVTHGVTSKNSRLPTREGDIRISVPGCGLSCRSVRSGMRTPAQ